VVVAFVGVGVVIPASAAHSQSPAPAPASYGDTSLPITCFHLASASLSLFLPSHRLLD
jgi:hypothetical protein